MAHGIEDSEILDSLGSMDESSSSFAFHICGSDPLYRAYFAHMNSGRMMVGSIITFRSAES
ncbi:unnamed protein product [Gongylonema pulchrum]|uniref:Uncharacterized protein n=1 Tax=Gongylonema pulchrum TaxID=637853 RepID=A0A183EL67_9BILA|nr:unnamed protein product [Gongylonema pulchrum]